MQNTILLKVHKWGYSTVTQPWAVKNYLTTFFILLQNLPTSVYETHIQAQDRMKVSISKSQYPKNVSHHVQYMFSMLQQSRVLLRETHCNSPLSSKLSLIFTTLFSLIPPRLHRQLPKASYPPPRVALPVPVFSVSLSLMSLSHPRSLISLSPLLSPPNLLPPSISPLISSYLTVSQEPFVFFILPCITPSRCPSLSPCSFVSSSSSSPLFFFALFISFTMPVTKQSKAEGQCRHMTDTKRPDWSSSGARGSVTGRMLIYGDLFT